ncbi:U8 snoRNA-decapping enzyme-like [Physella acuta]|uniref:U8 snoRNA-decapping enzyme-like n=1 Tax=Physella acuta TaxID=109671 RepID=UPI0027DB0BFA|nr:U8 snoRNA-decapping enzyme-like [Physella acuta]XP_059161341.1 U8 snoRNA-decapping enzyme-like [Physella acuta]XP_059161342.1 U8 snoRNA-decapping enzyme-like [Physella acuta]XP_059161343.1 U8 snoRNA-decapping enzyme-like [Physella acuta]XP_059161344.1 U8 snoRNA-decapping enzyme-like [Physella acuta]XP_059161346.1 U8 snoRNA-decapping enzyme-like [Physella acuta]
MADIGWGALQDSEGFGTLGDDVDDYKLLTTEELTNLVEPATNSDSCPLDLESNSKLKLQHASHGMIYANQKQLLWDLYEQKGLVMMQMRFDGVLGFPGGLVDEGETPVEGMNREMHEEIGLDLTKYSFNEQHHIASYLNKAKNLVLHFYLMEVTVEDFSTLELKTLNAKEYGIETYGIIRVPLFTMGDGLRGFPAFLANQFAGHSRCELILGLLTAKLFTENEMAIALSSYRQYAESLRNKKLL